MRTTTTILIAIVLAFVLNFSFGLHQSLRNWLSDLNPFGQGITMNVADSPERKSGATVQIALLLDTSGSMSGLIDQAKSQLWKIVNELTTAEHEKETPNIEIALYEYGNDRLSRSNGFVYQVTPFTSDMDLVSEQLFSLSTNGGDEYCGQVIATSLKELKWSNSPSDLKLIYIAGNEDFNQGPVPFAVACQNAKEQGVIVNTIYCGEQNEGINLSWKLGAEYAVGNYMNIDHNQATRYINSPYDDEIASLNDELNGTYIPYGKDGLKHCQNQASQDFNANQYSKANKVDRAVFKSSKNYDNTKWDLVDAYKKDKKAIEKSTELPAEYKGKSKQEIEKMVQQKLAERKQIQAKINELNDERKGYISTEKAKLSTESGSLESSVVATVKEQAKKKGYTFKK